MRCRGKDLKRVLVVAFHFPPAAMGSGHLRTLGFVRYLPHHGWDPIVLTARSVAYSRVHAANNKLVPEGCRVHRALALDVQRHLSIRGKYPGFLAQPDRWSTWWLAAVWQGLRLIRRHDIGAIWSTYPIMSAHCIAHTLSRRTELPWIADFRDPVASSVEAGNKFSVASQNRFEQRVVGRASRVVLTTPGAMRSYADRYPEAFQEHRLSVIPNGYDESAFAGMPADRPRVPGRPLRFVHSGILYPDGRDPLPFLTALANLKAAGTLSDSDIRIVLRASGSEAVYEGEIKRLSLQGMVTLAPPVPNDAALREQADADALLLFQGQRYDRQIPAKVYEYLRIGRPIFALIGEHGDTADLLRESGGARLVPLDDTDAIEQGLSEFILSLHNGNPPRASKQMVASYSRFCGAALLAKLLDDVVS